MRWYQYRLRTLLGVVTLIGVALGLFVAFAAPYQGQAATIALAEKLGGTCQTVEAAWWLRLAGEPRHITQVNLADCDEPEQYVAAIAKLPRVELVIVGGLNFTEEHAARLHKLRSLKGLILDSTSVSDEGLAVLRFAHPEVDIYASQRRAIAALRKIGGFQENARNTDHPFLMSELPDQAWFEEAIGYWARRSADDAKLAHLRCLRQLERLGLADTQVTDAGLAHLMGLYQLHTVSLERTQVTDVGLVHLKGLSRLDRLWLERTQVADAGLAHLKGLCQLNILCLERTQVTDAGLAHLKGLNILGALRLFGTRVTNAGVEELRHGLPNCWVSH